MSNTHIETPADNNNNKTWFGYFISTLLEWYHSNHYENKTVDDLESEWEYVLNETEQALLTQKMRQGEISEELTRLRSAAARLRWRPIFQEAAQRNFSDLTTAQRNALEQPLDAAKRSKLITDTIKECESDWFTALQDNVFKAAETENDGTDWAWEEFSTSFKEEQYSRNVLGSLREVGWQASHGNNGALNAKVLADICWSIWSALMSAVRHYLSRELTAEENTATANCVAKMQSTLVHMWLNTVRISKLGSAREGRVVQKWKALEHEKLAALKQRPVDSKYEGSRSLISESEKLHQENFSERRHKLEAVLMFRPTRAVKQH